MEQKKLQLDTIDKRIITELQKNGRESYKKIARKLDISDGTVRIRVEKMMKAGYFRIGASVNPLYFENCIVAQIGINLENRADRAVMEKISKFKGVQSVTNVTGRYDLLVEVFVSSRNELRKFHLDDLASISSIVSSESFVYLESVNKWVQQDMEE